MEEVTSNNASRTQFAAPPKSLPIPTKALDINPLRSESDERCGSTLPSDRLDPSSDHSTVSMIWTKTRSSFSEVVGLKSQHQATPIPSTLSSSTMLSKGICDNIADRALTSSIYSSINLPSRICDQIIASTVSSSSGLIEESIISHNTHQHYARFGEYRFTRPTVHFSMSPVSPDEAARIAAAATYITKVKHSSVSTQKSGFITKTATATVILTVTSKTTDLPTVSPTLPPSPSPALSEGQMIGIIVGGLMGFLIVLILGLILHQLVLRRRQQEKGSQYSPDATLTEDTATTSRWSESPSPHRILSLRMRECCKSRKSAISSLCRRTRSLDATQPSSNHSSLTRVAEAELRREGAPALHAGDLEHMTDRAHGGIDNDFLRVYLGESERQADRDVESNERHRGFV